MTSDVQSARVTFFNTTVSLYCVFAASGSARGCRFVLSLTDGMWEEIDILRSTAREQSAWSVQRAATQGSLLLLDVFTSIATIA